MPEAESLVPEALRGVSGFAGEVDASAGLLS